MARRMSSSMGTTMCSRRTRSTLWDSPPFDPHIAADPHNGQVIVARGAEDNKGQLMTFLDAARAWKTIAGALPLRGVRADRGRGGVRLAVAAGLPASSTAPSSNADLVLVCDTGQWDKDTPAITTMLRGLAAHRGRHHGPVARPALRHLRRPGGQPDPRARARAGGDARWQRARHRSGFLRRRCARRRPIRSSNGASSASSAEPFLADVGLTTPAGEAGCSVLEQLWSRPTLEFNGITGGYQGIGTKTVIPSKASAKITCRSSRDRTRTRSSSASRRSCAHSFPPDCSVEFTSPQASPAIAFETSTAPMQAAAAALEEEWGRPTVMMGCGASIPIVSSFRDVLGTDSLLVGFGVEDDRIHSPNEKYNLQSFKKGARSWARILEKLAA